MVLEARKQGRTKTSERPNTKIWRKILQKKNLVVAGI